ATVREEIDRSRYGGGGVGGGGANPVVEEKGKGNVNSLV
ncbi:hypothetical protein A2U01_0111215, partial [Trifolium medium]|nr:hypothetical protein [Trifolium medium]